MTSAWLARAGSPLVLRVSHAFIAVPWAGMHQVQQCHSVHCKSKGMVMEFNALPPRDLGDLEAAVGSSARRSMPSLGLEHFDVEDNFNPMSKSEPDFSRVPGAFPENVHAEASGSRVPASLAAPENLSLHAPGSHAPASLAAPENIALHPLQPHVTGPEAEHADFIRDMQAAHDSVDPANSRATGAFITGRKNAFQRSITRLQSMKPGDSGYQAAMTDVENKEEALRKAAHDGFIETQGNWNTWGKLATAPAMVAQTVNYTLDVASTVKSFIKP